MESGNVNEFIDNLEIQDEMVRFNGNLYYFYGIRFDGKKQLYYTRIDVFGDSIDTFIKELCYIEASTALECQQKLLNGNWFDGQSFWNVESHMIWVDG